VDAALFGVPLHAVVQVSRYAADLRFFSTPRHFAEADSSSALSHL